MAYNGGVSSDELDQIRRLHEVAALRIVALARLGVAAVMLAGTFVGPAPKWPQVSWVPWAYAIAAVVAAVLLFTPLSSRLVASRMQLVLLIIDVTAIFTFKIAAADGTYVPLLVLTLLPIMVVLDVSWRRAAVALAVIAGTFAVELFTDPVVMSEAGRGPAAMATAVFVFLCGTVFLTVRSQSRHLDEISYLSASRQDLLVELMAASDDQRRQISEYIHDGPLQSVLAARQDIMSALKKNPEESLERALAALREATDQMREATFELHPAVLAGAGLERAVTQLAAASSARSGIDFDVDIDYGGAHPIDAMVFAVVRELVSNVVRHSGATRSTITLKVVDDQCRLDVADDGVGLSDERALERLKHGHIGLASQRSRVAAAGGTMRSVAVDSGTHIQVRIPLRPLAGTMAASGTR